MNTHDPAHDQAHEEAQEALPWLANGTLAGAELERVRAHLQACGRCRADLALLHTVRAAGPGPDPACDPEAALARLLPRLDAPRLHLPPPAPAVPAPRRWRDRLAANDARWLRAAAALQCGVIAVLAVLLAGRHGAPADSGGEYRVLGAGKAGEARMVVMFKPATPEGELRRVLQAHGARVVGGPTVTGAWLLDTDGEPAATLAALRTEGAVALAEPLAAEGRP